MLKNKILLCVGEGLGNCIQVLPLLKVLKDNKIHFDILNLSNLSNETLGWVYSEYAEIITTLKTREYSGRIELATSKGNLKNAERLDIPLLNDLNKQNIYRADINEVEVYLSIAKELNLILNKKHFSVSLPEVEGAEAFDVVVHNGCTLLNKSQWERKKYPHMEKLVDRLLKEGYTVASIGAAEEYCGGENKTGLSIQKSAGLIKNSKCYLANDTGTFHLAAAMECQGLVLFTATSSIKNHHPTFHRTMKIVTNQVDCQPCQYKSSWNSCTNWVCRDIEVDPILKEIKASGIF